MFGAAILLASAISAPSFPDAALRRLNEYPTWAVREGKSTAAVLDLLVTPDGWVRDCTVISFVGDERLARVECEIHKRVRMRPAIGPDGAPIAAKYRTWINLWVDNNSAQQRQVQQAKWPPDMTLKLANLSERTHEPIDIELELLVDTTGAVIVCEAGRRYEESKHAALVQAGCREAMKLTVEPLVESSGAAVQHVANLRVRFEGAPSV